MEAFLTLAGAGEAETRVRGSVFAARAIPAGDADEAARVVADRQREHHDASHHCSAWRFRDGTWRAQDAGEPSGSAGAPILAAIDGAGLVDCAVVVTRWFGGTKLGVGGLIRAYGAAAAQALRAAPQRRGTPATRFRARYPYEHTAAVMRALEQCFARDVEHGFDAADALPVVTFSVAAARARELRHSLREQTAGAVAPVALGECVLYNPSPRPPMS